MFNISLCFLSYMLDQHQVKPTLKFPRRFAVLLRMVSFISFKIIHTPKNAYLLCENQGLRSGFKAGVTGGFQSSWTGAPTADWRRRCTDYRGGLSWGSCLALAVWRPCVDEHTHCVLETQHSRAPVIMRKHRALKYKLLQSQKYKSVKLHPENTEK